MSQKLSDYRFNLPDGCIAKHPAIRRDGSRLFQLPINGDESSHHLFSQLPSLLQEGDVLVMNETKVMPSRLTGVVDSGAAIELLLTDVVEQQQESCLVRGLVRNLKKLHKGRVVNFCGGVHGTFTGRDGNFGLFSMPLNRAGLDEWMQRSGGIPLPPYIGRAEEAEDRQRYQTIFAKHSGSCAAPTAGLHFTQELLQQLEQSGIMVKKICLHVGPGTFRPLEVDDISKHKIDAEQAEITDELYEELVTAKADGRRIIAVGTTTTRTLEAAAECGHGFSGKTGLFIYPSYKFKLVDGLITNFHLPESSLLMLVSALVGRQRLLAAYEQAIKKGYRFYSYGDAMLLT